MPLAGRESGPGLQSLRNFVRSLEEDAKPTVNQILAMLGLLTHSGLNENQAQFTASIQQATEDLLGKLDRIVRQHRVALSGTSSPPPDRGLAGKVLLVDSNAANHALFAGVLSGIGCEAHSVPNASAALQALSRLGYDAILTNMHLTGTTGEEFLREVRRRKTLSRAASHIPIIVYADPELWGDEDKCTESGADRFFPKPYECDTLVKALKPLIKQPLDPAANRTPTAAGPNRGTAGPNRGTAGANRGTAEEDVLLDTRVINSLRQRRAGNEPSAFVRSFKKYLESCPQMIGDIFHGFRGGKSENVEAAALKLKTSSAGIGGVRLARQCSRLQIACRMGCMDDAQEIVDSIEAIFRETCEALHSEVERDLRRRGF